MPVINGFIARDIAKASKQPRMINPANLSPERKRLLWEGIKILSPDLAVMIQQDSDIEMFKQQFNASICFSQDDFDRYTKSGRRVVQEEKNHANH